MGQQCLRSSPSLHNAMMFILLLVATWSLVAEAATVSPNDLKGKEYWSFRVTENGVTKDLVPDTRIILQFGHGDAMTLGVDAGCNSIGGEWTLDNENKLIVSQMSMTEIGCATERMEQDTFVANFFADSPKVTLTDDVEAGNNYKLLQLETDTIVMEFEDQQVANPNRPLVDTMWTVTGFVDGETASNLGVPQDGWIQFHSSGQFSFFDGCTTDQDTMGTYTITSEEAGTITFDSVDEVTCDATDMTLDYSIRFAKLFETTTATYEIKGANLQIKNSNNVGVTFRTDDDAPSGSVNRCPGESILNDVPEDSKSNGSEAPTESGTRKRNALVILMSTGIVHVLAMIITG